MLRLQIKTIYIEKCDFPTQPFIEKDIDSPLQKIAEIYLHGKTLKGVRLLTSTIHHVNIHAKIS